MKRNFILLKMELLVLLCILGTLSSCQKDTLLKPTLPSSASSFVIDSLKIVFDHSDFQKKLTTKTNENSNILWTPQWNNSFYNEDANDEYIYVPLIPKYEDSKMSKSIKLVNQLQYLLIKNKTEFIKATYTGLVNKSKPNFKIKEITGTLVMNNLENNNTFIYDYEKGLVKPNLNKVSKSSRKSNMTIMSGQLECHTTLSCTFTAVCSNANMVFFYSDMTGCNPPSSDYTADSPCTQVIWSLAYTTPHQICQWVEYPDPPTLPSDGGGGSDPGTPPIPSEPKPCPGDPIKNTTIAKSSPTNVNGGRYGNTRINLDGTTRFHGGVDIYAQPNTPLYPILNGTVVRIVNNIAPGQYVNSRSFGNLIEIETTLSTGEKVRTLYAHLNSITGSLQVGSNVSADINIGLTGRTGNAARGYGGSPHVHIQTKVNNTSVNPEQFIRTKFSSNGTPIVNPC